MEANRDFKKMSEIHKKLHLAFEKINDLQGRRVFGTYFRLADSLYNANNTGQILSAGLAFMAKGLVILMEKNLSTKNQCSPNYLRSSAGRL